MRTRIALPVLLLSLAACAVVAVPEPHFEFEVAPVARGYAVQEVEAPLLGGEKAYRLELRAGDCASERDCQSGRERAELKDSWVAPLQVDLWYAIRIYLPADYPEMSPKQILGQWHDGDRPALSNRYENGQFWIDLIGFDNTTAKFEVERFEKGRWHELAYNINWTPHQNGYFHAWLDGALVGSYQGRTLSADWRDGPRFKFGVYRSHVFDYAGDETPTQIAYFANFRRGLSQGDLALDRGLETLPE